MEAHPVSGDPPVADMGGVGPNHANPGLAAATTTNTTPGSGDPSTGGYSALGVDHGGDGSGVAGGGGTPAMGGGGSSVVAATSAAAGGAGDGGGSGGGGEYDPTMYRPLEIAASTAALQNMQAQQQHHDLQAMPQHSTMHPATHLEQQLSDTQLHQLHHHHQHQQQHQQQGVVAAAAAGGPTLHQQQLQDQQQFGDGGVNTYQMNQQQPQTAYKVFCGGLSFQTDEDKLREYFERLGTVVDVVIMRDRMSGHPRGFGFVSFAEESVAKDVASRRHDIDGRQVEAKIAIPRNQVPQPAAASGGASLRNGAPRQAGGLDAGGLMAASAVGSSSLVGTQVGSRPNSSHLNKIFVGGLPSQVGEAEFSEYFSQYGEVVDAQVMIDHQTGNSRGFGFISFADQSSVETVVGPGRSNTRHEIMGKTVEVKRAEPKGSTGDRRGRDSYSAGSGQRSQYGGASQGVSGMVASGNPPNAGVGAAAGVVPGAAAPGAAGGAYAGYNYPASIMEQYGAYYNNPQWQQYYAAMGYNMSAYPQGFNPYTYYAAYMNNAAVAGGTGGAAAGVEGADGGSAGSNPVPDGTGLSAGHGGEGQNRNGYGGTAGNGTGGPASGAAGAGPPGSGSGSSGPGARRVSRRDDRYHPYR